MKFILTAVIYIGCVITSQATEVVSQTAEQYQTYLANEFHQDVKRNVDKKDEGNADLMFDEALSLGNQGGMYWASQQISQYLQQRIHILDKVDFTPLIIPFPKYNVLPVVIVEDNGRRLISDKSKVMRILGKTYFIDSEPRLLSSIPSWRDYLYVDAIAPQKPHQSFNKLIKKYPDIWLDGIQSGWQIGVEQAIFTIQTRISRLTRDYIGLVRYHLIADANMVSQPIINEVYRPVSGGGETLSIEDTIISIEVAPRLSIDRYNWQAIPRLPDVSHLFPDIIQSTFIHGLRHTKEAN